MTNHCNHNLPSHTALRLVTNYFSILFLLPMVFFFSGCKAQSGVIAFPGAEGFGKNASGGRGGEVIYVTNLNDDGPGSLRSALKVKSPRIVVFNVAGNIELASPLDVNHGDVTIAGQSAPGDGICIQNYPVSIKSDNVIVRFLRFRLGDKFQQEADALSGNSGAQNVIIDHCSISWGTDECASFYRNKNFTMQWCIISESLNQSVHTKGDHGYGGIWGGEGATFHHNLIASHTSRTPRFSGSATTANSKDELVEFTNNVIYNWKNNNAYGGEGGRYNMVANYYKAGPATNKAKDQFINPWAPYGKFYLNRNVMYGNIELTNDNMLGVKPKEKSDTLIFSQNKVNEPITVQPPEIAYELVLPKAGASLSRDAVDSRIVSEVRNGNSSKGKSGDGIIDSQEDVGGWPKLKSGTPRVDSDNDGIPDEWEIAKGLNPNDPKDASARSLHKDYDNIEVFLNSIVESIMK